MTLRELLLITLMLLLATPFLAFSYWFLFVPDPKMKGEEEWGWGRLPQKSWSKIGKLLLVVLFGFLVGGVSLVMLFS